MRRETSDYYQQAGPSAATRERVGGRYGSSRRIDPSSMFLADDFTIGLQNGWQSKTVYVLEGPLEHHFRHTITINVDPEAGNIALIDYADMQIEVQLNALKGCRLLMKGYTRLDSDVPAYRAIFVWYPTDDRRIYQDQFVTLHKKVGYTLTAHFTKKTRKTIGPRIERAMRSFEPNKPLQLRR